MAIFGKRKEKERDRQAQAQAQAEAFASAPVPAPVSAAAPPASAAGPSTMHVGRLRKPSEDTPFAAGPPPMPPSQRPGLQMPYPPASAPTAPPHPAYSPSPHPPLQPHPPQQPQQRPRPPQQYPWTRRPLSLLPASFFDDQQQATSLSPNPFPRYGLAANQVATPSGDIILFGGIVDGVVRNDLYIINVEQVNQHAPLPPGGAASGHAAPTGVSATLVQCVGQAPPARVGHACVLVNNVLLLWGGDTKYNAEDEHDQALYLLNLSNCEWTRVTSVDSDPDATPPGRYRHTMSVVGNKMYIFGGQSEGQLYNDLWSFDLNSLKTGARWERIVPDSEVPAARTGHTSVTYKDKIYIFGGTDSQYHYKDTWIYDVASNRWSEMSCIGFIPHPREGHATCLVGDNMYIFGGRGVDGKELGDLASLMISRNRWFMFSNMGPAPAPRSGHVLSTYQDKIIVLGGESYIPNPLDDPNYISVLHTAKIKYPEEPNPASKKDVSSPTGSGSAAGGVSATPTAHQAMGSTSGPPQAQQPATRVISPPAAQYPVQIDNSTDQARVVSPPGTMQNSTPSASTGHRGGRIRSPSMSQEQFPAGSSSQSHSTSPYMSGSTTGTPVKGSVSMGAAADNVRGAALSSAPNGPLSHPATAPLSTAAQPTESSMANGSPIEGHQTNVYAGSSKSHVLTSSDVRARTNTPESSPPTARDMETRGFISSDALSNPPDGDMLRELTELDVGPGESEKSRIVQSLLMLKSQLAQAQTTIAEQTAREMDIKAEAEQSRGAILTEAAYYRAKLSAYETGNGSEVSKLEQQRSEELEARISTAMREKAEAERQLISVQEQYKLEAQLRLSADERLLETSKRTAAAEAAQMKVSKDLAALQQRAIAAENALRDQTERAVTVSSLLDREKAEHERTRSAMQDATALSTAHGDSLLHLQAALASTAARAEEHHRLYVQHRDLAQTNQEVVTTLQAQLDQKNQETLAQGTRIKDLERLLTAAEAEAETHRLASTAGLAQVLQTRDIVSQHSADARVPAEVEDQLRSLEEQVASLQEMHSSARAAVDQATDELTQVRQFNVELEKQRSGVHAEFSVARSQLAIALQELTRLKDKLAQSQGEARESGRRAEQAQIKLQVLRDHLRQQGIPLPQEEEDEGTQVQLASLQQQLEQSTRTAADCQAQLGDAQAEVISLKRIVAQMVDPRKLDEAVARAEASDRAAEEVRGRYKERLKQLETDYATAVSYVKATEKKIRQLRDELSRANEENAALSEQLTHQSIPEGDVLAALEARLANLASTNKDMRAENRDLERRIATIIAEQNNAQERSGAQVEAACETDKKLSSLQVQVSTLERSLAQSRDDLERILDLNQHLSRELAQAGPSKRLTSPLSA